MDLLGPFQELGEGEQKHLLFYPFSHGIGFIPDDAIVDALPAALRGSLVIERILVPPGWEEGWKEHFHPAVIGRLYIRPPWEEPPHRADLVDLVLTPGLAFGTGLHPTTRGILTLLQDEEPQGPVIDAGTGSGILAIAAAKLGYRPARAVDNDPLAVEAARMNATANGVELEVALLDLVALPSEWLLPGTTVLANVTLEPILLLLRRLAEEALDVRRLLVAGILAGEQEETLLSAALDARQRLVQRLPEGEWVSLDLRPVAPGV